MHPCLYIEIDGNRQTIGFLILREGNERSSFGFLQDRKAVWYEHSICWQKRLNLILLPSVNSLNIFTKRKNNLYTCIVNIENCFKSANTNFSRWQFCSIKNYAFVIKDNHLSEYVISKSCSGITSSYSALTIVFYPIMVQFDPVSKGRSLFLVKLNTLVT